MARQVFVRSSEPYSSIINMKDLKLEHTYYIKYIEKCKYGYICETVDPNIEVIDKDGNIIKLNKEERKAIGVRFYSNKRLTREIEMENINEFFLIVHAIKEARDSKGKTYQYPDYSISVVKSKPDSDIEYD